MTRPRSQPSFNFDPGSDSLTEDEERLWTKLWTRGIIDLPKEGRGWIVEWVRDNLRLNVNDLEGFDFFTASIQKIATSEALAVGQTTYTNLATTGPELTGLPNGEYLLLYGCNGKRDTQAVTLHYSPSINGAAASDTDSAQVDTQIVDFVTLVSASLKTLSSNNNNSVLMKYRQTGTTTIGTFKNRWLVALKVANV